MNPLRALFAKKQPSPTTASSISAAKVVDSIFNSVQHVSGSQIELELQRVGIKRKDLRKLTLDDEIYTAIETRRSAVEATPWQLEPSENDLSQAITEIINPHIKTIVSAAINATLYGYAVIELIWEEGNKGITLKDVRNLPFDWFDVDSSGQWVNVENSAIPIDTQHKFIVITHNASIDEPKGDPLLARAYWAWRFRTDVWRYWMRYLERFADPVLLGKVSNPADFISSVTQMGLDSAIAVGSDESVEAIIANGVGEFERIETVLRKRFQRLILGQNLTSEVSGGSLAAAEVHERVLEDRRNADIEKVEQATNKLITALMDLCTLPAGEQPVFAMRDDTGLEEKRADRDAKLMAQGVKLTEQYLLRAYDFQQGDIDTTLAQPASDKSANLSATFSAKPSPFTPVQTAVEGIADDALAKTASPIDPSLIRNAILAAKNPEDLEERLSTLLNQRDPNFQQLVEQAIFAADVLGYVAEAEQKI
jgi:phage gp29-like protein